MLLRSLRSVSGRVVDRQKKPVANIQVFQTGDGPEPTSTRTGADGPFALTAFARARCSSSRVARGFGSTVS